MENSPLDKIAIGAGIVLGGVILSKFLSYFYRLVVARIGPEEYGLLSIGLAVAGILTVLASFGLDTGIMKYVSLYRSKKEHGRVRDTILSCSFLILIFSLIAAILLFLFSDQISLKFFNNIRLSPILKILALTIPLNSLREVIFSIIKSFEKVKYEIYAKNIVENLSKIILTLILIILGFGVIGATFAYLFAVLISFLFGYYYLQKKIFPFLIKSKFNPIYKRLVNYSWPLFLTGFTATIIAWTDTFMLGIFRKAEEVGFYNAALPTANLTYIIPYSFIILLFPVVTELYSHKKLKEVESLYKRVTKWIISINLIVLGGFLLFPKEILTILFPNEYVVGYLALMILSLGFFLTYSVYPSQRFLMIIGRTKLVFLNSLITAILNIILNYFLINSYGITGAAIATSISLIIGGFLPVIQIYSIKKIHPFRKKDILIIFSFLISFIFTKYIYNLSLKGIKFVITFAIIFIFIYLALLILTKSIEREDKTHFNSLLSSIRKKLNHQ